MIKAGSTFQSAVRITALPGERQAAMSQSPCDRDGFDRAGALDARWQPMPASERILVSLATYNERDNLEPLLEEIHKVLPAADILVIDDNSPDGTGRLADSLAAADDRLHVLHRPGKLGLGT